MFKYSINLAWSDEDSCYIATVAEFPGLSAFGESPEEAAAEAKMAAEGFLEVYREDGCEIPEPDIIRPFSGQTRLRLPKTLHSALHKEAQREGVSLNTYLVSLLSERNVSRQLKSELSDLKSLVLLKVLQPVNQKAEARSDVQSSVFNLDGEWPEATTHKQYET